MESLDGDPARASSVQNDPTPSMPSQMRKLIEERSQGSHAFGRWKRLNAVEIGQLSASVSFT